MMTATVDLLRDSIVSGGKICVRLCSFRSMICDDSNKSNSLRLNCCYKTVVVVVLNLCGTQKYVYSYIFISGSVVYFFIVQRINIVNSNDVYKENGSSVESKSKKKKMID